jgi:hypothetical protein
MGASLALIVVGLVVIAAFEIPRLTSSNPEALVAFPVLAVAVLVFAGLAGVRATRDQDGAVEGVLAVTTPYLPGAVSVTIIALFLLGQSAPYAIGMGLVITTVAWLAVGFVFTQYARIDHAQPRNYAELVDRFKMLAADVEVFASDTHVNRLQNEEHDNALVARGQLRDVVPTIARTLGLEAGTPPASGRRWALRSGYVDLWNTLNRAEEALIELNSDPNVIAAALHDKRRLEGSAIGNAKHFAEDIDDAIATLRDAGADVKARVEARRKLRDIRQEINNYRNANYDQMLDARHQLLSRMVFTGVVADLILVLALVMGVDQTLVLGASAFYLVGAVIGLFSRLYAESSTSSTVDDYGLVDARLLVTPLISGLAAVAGVALSAMLLLPGSDILAPATVDDTGKTVNIASEVRTPPELSEIFDLDANPGGLVIAAVFGLTPGLLLERLKSEAEKYKSNLQTSSASDGKQ